MSEISTPVDRGSTCTGNESQPRALGPFPAPSERLPPASGTAFLHRCTQQRRRSNGSSGPENKARTGS